MAADIKKTGLKKELGLLSVYALATGATLSSGFFLLPGLAYKEAGPAMVLCYMLAVIPLIPAMFSIVELGSAMPRAGGAYYFLDRTMGPMIGTIGGLGTWFALMLKTAFALIGMGAYIKLYIPGLQIEPVAAVLAAVIALMNLGGAKKIGSIQTFLVAGLLAILLWFIASGSPVIQSAHFNNFFGAGGAAIAGTTGFVCISYVGITNVASVSEEIRNPERNLPLGVFLAVATAVAIYGIGTLVMVGVLQPDDLAKTHTPVADAARILGGRPAQALLTVAALLAFFAVANAGILSSSRYPLAMSRDHLLPGFFGTSNSRGMPSTGIYTTLAVILFIIFVFDVAKIAKLASAFQLLLFAMLCLAVILMRESGLESYDPGFRAPFYPWLHMIGIAVPIWLIQQMGGIAVIFSCGLLAAGLLWFHYYAKARVARRGAILHVFERLGRARDEGLDRELRQILKEKGARAQDPNEEIILQASVLDLSTEMTFEEITHGASSLLTERITADGLTASFEQILNGFLQGTRIGATPVSHGAALPHHRLPGLSRPRMVIVRSQPGMVIEAQGETGDLHHDDDPVHAVFFLLSPEEDPAQHLRILAHLATHFDDEKFMDQWLAAADETELKSILLRDRRFISVELLRGSSSEDYIDKPLNLIKLPAGCLVAVIRRGDERIVPDGREVMREHDHITIIGKPDGIATLYAQHHKER